MTTSTKRPDPYRDAIDEALIVRHLGVAKGDARTELETVISWEVSVALDPRVSSSAQALIDQGRIESPAPQLREALKSAVAHIDHMAAWITAHNAGLRGQNVSKSLYSFESLGEDMPGIRAALASPSLTAGENTKETALREARKSFQRIIDNRDNKNWRKPELIQEAERGLKSCSL